jgi:hypothetical protein
MRCKLDAGDRDRRATERLLDKHHGDAVLDAPMVLLNQVFKCVDERCVGSKPSPFSSRACGGTRVAVQCDRLWRVLVVIDRFAVSVWHTTIGRRSENDEAVIIPPVVPSTYPG